MCKGVLPVHISLRSRRRGQNPWKWSYRVLESRSARIKPWSSVRAVCFELLNCVFSTSVCDLKLVCLSPSWELDKGVGKEGTES